MNHQLPEQRPQDFRIFDGSADLSVRVKSTAEMMREILNPPIPHTWDRDGERCTVCGAKDWMGGSCRPRPLSPETIAGIKRRVAEMDPEERSQFAALTRRADEVMRQENATPPERADFLAACGRVGERMREARS